MNNPTQSQKYDVVIIGSGFSGIVAADILAKHQLNILMLDENMHVGGQLLRKIPEQLGEYASYNPDYVKKLGFRFVQNVKHQKITIMNRACIMGIYPDKKLLLEVERKQVMEINYNYLVFATGARERYLPFTGWTLPGVYSTGMAQVLMKSSGILPAKSMVIGGSGLFLFSVAYEYLKNKGKAVAVLEQTGMMEKIKMVPALAHQFSKVAEGFKYLSRIYLSGVPVKYSTKIVEARGNGCVEEVVTGKVNSDGRLISGSEKIYKADALAVGYGFVPNIEAPQLAGCDLEYAEDKGGWIVRVNDNLETSVKDIYAAGEITGVGGALKSINEGNITAVSILHKMELMAESDYVKNLARLLKERGHHMQFVHFFNSLYRVPAEALNDIPDETVICRCEDITMGDIRKSVAAGYKTPKGLKTATRVTMGNCQGRTCGPVLYDMLGLLTGQPKQSFGLFNTRPPLKPLSVEALAGFVEKD